MSIPPYHPQPTASYTGHEKMLQKLKNKLKKPHNILKSRPESPIKKLPYNHLKITEKNQFKAIILDQIPTTPPAWNGLSIPITLEGVAQARRSLLRASTNNLGNTIDKFNELKKIEAQMVEETIDELQKGLSNVTITPDSL